MLIHSAETEETFRRDREAVDKITDREWSGAERDQARRSVLAAQAAYDATFNQIITRIAIIDPRMRPRVKRLLLLLSEISNTIESSHREEVVAALTDFGLVGLHRLFNHDLKYISDTCVAPAYEMANGRNVEVRTS